MGGWVGGWQLDRGCLDSHLVLSSFMAAVIARSTVHGYLQARDPADGDFAETPTRLR